MDDTVNKRNTETFRQAIDNLNLQISILEQRVNEQNHSIATLTQRVSQAEQQVQIAKVLLTGRGPSA
jgi:CII-binding regulator of phage lambda lysogenization HflD